MNMKPIIRWTIGMHNPDSYLALNLSIENFHKIYNNRFDYYVCYNNCNSDHITKKIKLKLIDQREHIHDLPCLPSTTSWKLYPPRLNEETHEIFMDNDIIIYKSIDLIDAFLSSNNMTIMTEGYHRRFGTFDDRIKPHVKYNSGLIGIPPKFDFKNKIIQLLGNNTLEDWFDEQGLVAYILSNHTNFQCITLKEIQICYEDLCFGISGIHFVGLNSNKNRFWSKFLSPM